MLRMAERVGDRLLSLAVPRVKARAYWCRHCTGAWSQRCFYDEYGNLWCTAACVSC